MEKFKKIKAIVAPMDRANVDTDAIIPKQFLKSIKRSGFGPNLFDEWRYLDHGEPGMDNSKRTLNPDFVLNNPKYSGKILVAGLNFGCGSSREHAPWAIADFGFRVVVSSFFADIFKGNALNNGILPIQLEESQVQKIFTTIESDANATFSVNINAQTITIDITKEAFGFDIDPYKKECLINGYDDLDFLLSITDKIEKFEETQVIY